jgi:G3E family GTPase
MFGLILRSVTKKTSAEDITMSGMPLRVTVVVGFLGSGKTTLVDRIVSEWRGAGERVALVVNDYADVNIDATALAGSGLDAADEPVDLSGGCICCTLLPQLVLTVGRVVAARQHSRLVIESTGIGEPGPIVEGLLTAPWWCADIVIDAVVCVVDATAFLRSKKLAPLLLDQVAPATVVIANKADAVSTAALAELHARVVGRNDRCAVVSATRCEVPLDDLARQVPFDAGAFHRQFDAAADAEGHVSEAERFGFSSVVIAARRPLRLDRALAAVASGALLRGVFRSKGYVTAVTADGDDAAAVQHHSWHSVGRCFTYGDVAADSWVPPVVSDGVRIVGGGEGDLVTLLVFIGTGVDPDGIAEQMEACLA